MPKPHWIIPPGWKRTNRMIRPPTDVHPTFIRWTVRCRLSHSQPHRKRGQEPTEGAEHAATEGRRPMTPAVSKPTSPSKARLGLPCAANPDLPRDCRIHKTKSGGRGGAGQRPGDGSRPLNPFKENSVTQLPNLCVCGEEARSLWIFACVYEAAELGIAATQQRGGRSVRKGRCWEDLIRSLLGAWSLFAMDQLGVLLGQFLVPDNASRKQAEEQIRRLSKDPLLVPALLHHVRCSPYPEVRQLAAVLLRKKITGHWMQLSAEMRNNVKSTLLESITLENRCVETWGFYYFILLLLFLLFISWCWIV